MNGHHFKYISFVAILVLGAGSIWAFARPHRVNEQTTAAQQKPQIERPAVKLDDGRIVLYPDLAKQISFELPKNPDEDERLFKKFIQQVRTDVFTEGNVPLERGRDKIKWERYSELQQVMTNNINVVKSGSWDSNYLIRIMSDLDELARAASDVPMNPLKMKSVHRGKLLFAYQMERFVKIRIDSGRHWNTFLPPVRAYRYRCELDLAEAEDAAAKAP